MDKSSPNIYQYIESARIAWLGQVGALPDPAGAGEGPVIVNAYCSFLKQLTYPMGWTPPLYGIKCAKVVVSNTT